MSCSHCDQWNSPAVNKIKTGRDRFAMKLFVNKSVWLLVLNYSVLITFAYLDSLRVIKWFVVGFWIILNMAITKSNRRTISPLFLPSPMQRRICSLLIYPHQDSKTQMFMLGNNKIELLLQHTIEKHCSIQKLRGTRKLMLLLHCNIML